MKNKSNRLRRVIKLLAGSVFAMCFAGTAHAVCTNYGSAFSFTIPDVRLVGNSADVDETISPWFYSNRANTMICGTMGSYAQSNSYTGLPAEVGTHTIGSSTYGVFATSIPGVAFILAADVQTGGVSHFVPVRGGSESGLQYLTDNESVGGAIAIRFIKVGDTQEGSYSVAGFPAFTLKHYQPASNKRFEQQHLLEPFNIEVVHVPLCHVQSKTVYMGLANLDQFKTQGAAAPSRPYSVEINCEAGAGRVNYYLEPSSVEVYDRTRGILAVEGGAKGIGLQLLDEHDVPVAIGPAYPFGSSTADGVRSETFRARYIRTASGPADLETGPANARIRYRIDYP
ncbi:TPA: fimbrial protein [Stenotrophomonas maltophilia]